MNHSINWEDQLDYYNRQLFIHQLLVDEYNKHGLEYGGRSYYTPYNKNNIKNVHGFNFIEPAAQGSKLDGSSNYLGSKGSYTKMDVNIHRTVLSRLYNQMYKATNKHILDKFNTVNVKDGDLSKIVSITTELLSDINLQKKWAIEAIKILSNAQRRLIKNNNTYLLTINELENIGRAILGRSTELCPIETGQLRASGKLYIFNDHIRIIYECPYAIYQHENTSFRHAYGRDHFLQIAAQEILHNLSVWTETGMNNVFGSYMKQAWVHDDYDNAVGDATWVELHTYNTVFIDIDRNLRVNYAH